MKILQKLFQVQHFQSLRVDIYRKKKHFYRCSNLRKAAELGYFYALLTDEEKATWKSKDELAQALNCSIYPDAVFTRGGIPSGVFVIKTEDVDEKLPELKEFAKEQKIKIILKRI